MKNLSILIPTVPPRKLRLNKLLSDIQRQVVDNSLEDKIEVIVFEDDFENTIGYKRNKLLEAANGKFTCFVDDDDKLHSEYCKIISEAIEEHDDIQQIGFKLKLFINGRRRQETYHSLQYKGWYQNRSGYYRETTTLNPMLASISKQFVFPEKNNEEDKDWVNKVIESGLLKKEYYIDDYMYEYMYNDSTSLSFTRRNANRNNQKIDWELKEIDKLKVEML